VYVSAVKYFRTKIFSLLFCGLVGLSESNYKNIISLNIGSLGYITYPIRTVRP